MAKGKTRERLIRARHRVVHVIRDMGGDRPDVPVWYLADGNPEIDAMMEAVGRVAGGFYRFELARVSFRDFPETDAINERAFMSAKRPPSNNVSAWLKRRLYRGQYNWSRQQFSADRGKIALAWNGLTSTRLSFMEGAGDAGAGRLYMERAPLPGRVTLDHMGINYLNSVPRERAFFDAWAEGDPARAGDGWRDMAGKLTARPSTRDDVGQGDGGDLTGRFLFCPLQVPNDTQVRQFGGWVGSVEGQIRAMAAAAPLLPEGWHLRIKEHPSSRIAFGPLLAEVAAGSGGRIVVDNATDTFAQVAASAGVITINSSVGLQAFFYDRPVMVLGQAFYGQEGLVTPALTEAAMRETFGRPEEMTFDPSYRAAFMNWLDQVYYPKVSFAPDGTATIDPEITAAKLHMAGWRI